MYTFAGGKDSTVTPASFLPRWWFEHEGEGPEESKEAKMAKFAQVFGALGGTPKG